MYDWHLHPFIHTCFSPGLLFLFNQSSLLLYVQVADRSDWHIDGGKRVAHGI